MPNEILSDVLCDVLSENKGKIRLVCRAMRLLFNQQVTHFIVTHNNKNTIDLERLIQSLPALRNLHVEYSRYPYAIYNKVHTLRAWAAGNVEQATELTLWFNTVRNRCLPEDEEDPTLIISMKQASEVALIAPELEKLSCLHTLNIHCDFICKFGSPALEKLIPSLAALSSLRSLSIQVKLGNKGVRMLKTLFMTMGERLHLLNLESSISRCGVSGVSALSDVLQLLPELRDLNISYNELGSDSFAKISAALPKLPKLQILNAGMNLIGDDGCFALAEAIKELPHLQDLDISGNLISDTGVLELAEALRKLPGFKFICVNGNAITPNVIAKIVAGGTDLRSDD